MDANEKIIEEREYNDEEYDECNYCDEKILITKMDIANWVNCAYYCDSCIDILREEEEEEYDDYDSDSSNFEMYYDSSS